MTTMIIPQLESGHRVGIAMLGQHRSFQRQPRLYLCLLCVIVWILCLFVFHIGYVQESPSPGRRNGQTYARTGIDSEEFEAGGSVSALRARPPGNGTSKTLQSPSGFPLLVSPHVRTLTECCSRLLAERPRWKPGADCWRSVERLQSATRRTRSLLLDKVDTEPVECLLKNTPVERVQLFSNQDHWFQDSMSGAATSPVGSLPGLVTSFPDAGSTHKWLVTLEGGQRAIFKPQWYGYNSTRSDWFLGYELHTSEVLAFHLDRILGFGRYPTTVERHFHIPTEIIGHASPKLRQHFSRKDGEWCLRDKCYFCTSDEETCTVDGVLAGSLSYYVSGQILNIEHPWNIKEYYRHIQYGFNNKSRCEFVRLSHPSFWDKERFLDLVDMNILDYLTYHFDSKFYTLKTDGNTDVTLHLDRGRALRSSTWSSLRTLHHGGLSNVLRTSLHGYDQLLASLPTSLFQALDRRSDVLIQTVSRCINQNGNASVLL